MSENRSEIIALQALDWLIGNDELREVFMGSSGLDAESLKAGAGDSTLLVAVLDFIGMDDAWILGFCEYAGVPPENFRFIAQGLPGGEVVHWT